MTHTSVIVLPVVATNLRDSALFQTQYRGVYTLASRPETIDSSAVVTSRPFFPSVRLTLEPTQPELSAGLQISV